MIFLGGTPYVHLDIGLTGWLIILLLVAIYAAYYYYTKWQEERARNADQLEDEESEIVVDA